MQLHSYTTRPATPTEQSTQLTDRIALVVLAATTSGLVAIALAFLP